MNDKIEKQEIERNTFYFKDGLYGLETLKRYIFVKKENKSETKFKLMISLEDPDYSFIVVPPFEVYEDYEIKIEEEVLKEIGAKEIEDVLVLCLVILSKKENSIFINLKSPLILSTKTNKGKQIIIDDARYEIQASMKIKYS